MNKSLNNIRKKYPKLNRKINTIIPIKIIKSNNYKLFSKSLS